MEIEYSNEVRGQVFAYRFDGFEKQQIAAGLRLIINKTNAKMNKIINHPKNEGQATYAVKIDTLRHEIKVMEKVVKEFG